MTERYTLLTTPRETYSVTGILMGIGGFLEVYTYLEKGGVFCNAQTGNIALLAVSLAQGNLVKALDCMIPIVSYIIGICLTAHMSERTHKGLRWETIFIILELCVFVLVGALPDRVPYGISTVAIAFVCSMQYHTFTKAHGIPMATTFCTNNLRQASLSFYKAFHEKDKLALQRGIFFVRHITFFLIGGFLGTLLCKFLAERAIWVCALLLLPVLGIMIYADSRKSNRQERRNICKT